MAEYNKQYTPTLWKNYPLTDTSINAYRLNHLEGGVNENDNRLVALSEDKAEQAVVNKMVKTVTLNKDTGVLTVGLHGKHRFSLFFFPCNPCLKKSSSVFRHPSKTVP